MDFDSDAIVDNGFVVARLPDLGMGCDGVTQGLLTAIELHTAGGFSLDREVKFTSDGYTTPPYGVCATCWERDEFLTLMSSSDYIVFAGHGTPLAFFNNSNDAKFTVGYMDSVDLWTSHPVVIGYYSCNTGNMQLDSPTLSSGFPAAGAAAFLARTTTDGVPTHVANEVHAGIFAGDRIGDVLFRSMRETVLIYGAGFKAAAGHLILYGDPTLRRRVSAPSGFIGTYTTGTGELLLRWRHSPVVDLSHYTVHQGIEPDFTPSPDNRIAETADTVITLHGISPMETWCMKVAAVNTYGNVSSYVDLASVDVTVPTYVQRHEAVWIGKGVEITWALATDQTHLDFEIARKDGPDTDFKLLDGPVLQDGGSFSFVDLAVRPGGAYVYRVGVIDSGALVASFTTALDVPAVELTLDQNHPNPFNPSTTISFTLPSRVRAMLSVYDVRGKLVTIVADETAVGYREHKWDGRDADGAPVSSGVYFYRLTAGKRTLTKKMVMLK